MKQQTAEAVKLENREETVAEEIEEAEKPQARLAEGKRELVSVLDRKTVGELFVDNPRMSCRNVDVYYDDNHAIKNVSLDIGKN